MEETMRSLILAAGMLLLAGCTTANQNAMNANAGQQTAAQDPNAPDPAGPSRDDRRTVPWIFRRPPPQSGLWGGPGFGYGSMY
jgi:hypothetical protein